MSGDVFRSQMATSTDPAYLERMAVASERPRDMLDLPLVGHYGVVLADPPWAFKTYGGKNGTPHRSAEDHYKTVERTDLAALPVARLPAKDAVMFMWVVDSHVDQGIDLAKAWGFGFKTIAFIWVKTAASGQPRIGMGYWTRKSAEICLMFTRGKPKRLDKGVREVIMAQRREHSRKPDEQYGLIERLVAGPYVELFSRTRRDGWDSWGAEVGKFS